MRRPRLQCDGEKEISPVLFSCWQPCAAARIDGGDMKLIKNRASDLSSAPWRRRLLSIAELAILRVRPTASLQLGAHRAPIHATPPPTHERGAPGKEDAYYRDSNGSGSGGADRRLRRRGLWG